MESLGEYIKKNYKNNKDILINNFDKLYDSNQVFKKVVNNLDTTKEKLINNTSKIMDCVNELNNCMNCKNIFECKNEVKGYVYYPSIENEEIVFSYKMCKYKKAIEENNAYQKNIISYDMPKELLNASMKNILTDDENRYEVILWLKNFIDNYKKNEVKKGLYLTGNFGCGKTYLVCAMLNELAKKNHKVAVIYYPEFLKNLKESFSEGYSTKFDAIKKAEILLIDDLGAETTTSWGRDEVLGTILQYRMQENLATFFTSNFTLEELEEHFSFNKGSNEKVKARRIMERIKQLTEYKQMISINRRK